VRSDATGGETCNSGPRSLIQRSDPGEGSNMIARGAFRRNPGGGDAIETDPGEGSNNSL